MITLADFQRFATLGEYPGILAYILVINGLYLFLMMDTCCFAWCIRARNRRRHLSWVEARHEPSNLRATAPLYLHFLSPIFLGAARVDPALSLRLPAAVHARRLRPAEPPRLLGAVLRVRGRQAAGVAVVLGAVRNVHHDPPQGDHDLAAPPRLQGLHRATTTPPRPSAPPPSPTAPHLLSPHISQVRGLLTARTIRQKLTVVYTMLLTELLVVCLFWQNQAPQQDLGFFLLQVST